MQFTVQKTNILSALDVTLRAVPTKSNSKVLLDFLIEVDEEGNGFVSSFGLGMSIKSHFTCMATEQGKICVDAKMLSQIIKKMGKADISFKTEENKVIITGAKAKYELPIDDADEFPSAPSINDSTKFSISSTEFKDMVDGVAFSTSTNQAQPTLQGINIRIDGKKLRFSTCDLTRISIRQTDVDCSEKVNVTVPLKAMTETSKSLEDDETIIIEVSKMNVRFAFGQTQMIARVIDGKFFNIDQMFKDRPQINVEISKEQLASCMDRASIVVEERTPIIMDISDDVIKMSVKTNISNFDEDLECTKQGNDIRIGFNPRYVLDALKVIPDDDITMGMNNDKSPMFITDEKEDRYAYLILPINI